MYMYICIVLFKSAFNILSDVNDKTDEIMTYDVMEVFEHWAAVNNILLN